MRIKDIASTRDFANIAWLCALGARVCYTKKSLDELLQESKITQRKETKDFLLRLCSYKHFSVFSHAFTYKKIDKEKAIYLAAKYFKTYWNEETPDVIGFSLRHYLEDLSEEEREKAIEEIIDLNQNALNPAFVDKNDNVTLVYISREYYGYAVFYLENISRVMTHQLVRHTFLNFSQRSQRYVLQFPKKKDLPRPDMMITPPSISSNKEALEIFLKAVKTSEDAYIDLVNMGIPAEDARFILPHGQKTNIVLSAPIPHLQDFISKRIEKGAQWEIRDVAIKMDELLKNH
ncbi:FAD-dependent thymidylate synthase [Hydrogenobaculum acidophilum]